MSPLTDDDSSGPPPGLRGLPREQSRLILDQPPCWEYLLFSEALIHEIAGLSDMKRDLRFGIVSGAVADMTPRAFLGWAETRFSEVRGFVDAIEKIVNHALPQALGPDGEAGDPQAILYCARKLAGVYRSAMRWRAEFLKVNVPAEMENLKAAVARFGDQIAPQIEDFGSRASREIKQAVADTQAGKAVTLSLRLDLTSPGTAQIDHELQRLRHLLKH